MSIGDPDRRTPLWFMDGARYGRVEARFEPDGGLEITHHEMGAADRAVWGEDDHEASLRLEPGDVAKLAMALLRERCAGRADALEAVREICDTHGVPAKFSVWT